MKRQIRAALGNRSVSPEALYTIFLPLTPLLWVVKVRVTTFVACGSDSVVVDAKTLRPQLNVTSLRRNGVLLDVDLV